MSDKDARELMMSQSISAQVEYGRWLISSLLALHSAAIAGLIYSEKIKQVSPCTVVLFLVGLVLALAAGFIAWLNFKWAYEHYRDNDNKNSRLDASTWAAIACSVGSAGFFVIGVGIVAVQLLGK